MKISVIAFGMATLMGWCDPMAVVARVDDGSSDGDAGSDTSVDSDASSDTFQAMDTVEAAPDVQPSDAPVACTPGQTQSCYTGPMGTEGVGTCHGGTVTCPMSGFWPSDQLCPGEIIPSSAEHCGDGLDDDCDGQVDEDCMPVPTVASVAGGPSNTAALLADGTVRCWGSGQYGEIGDGLFVDRPLPEPVMGVSTAVQIAVDADWGNMCAVLSDHTVQCWGQNDMNELGTGDFANRPAPTTVPGVSDVTQVAANGGNVLALRSDGTVYVWGQNQYVVLTAGNLRDGGNPDPAPALLPGVSQVTQVALGSNHACVILMDQSVQCWGVNTFGEAGTTNTPQSTPVTVAGLSNVVELALGSFFSCARRSSGDVWCWGADDTGQLGNGSGAMTSTPIQVAGITDAVQLEAAATYACARRSSGSTVCWGVDRDLGLPATGTQTQVGMTVTDDIGLAIAPGHICMQRSAGGVVCWGSNATYQLGDGTNVSRLTPAPVDW